MLDLDAPIVPGRTAAGLVLGGDVAPLLQAARPRRTVVPARPPLGAPDRACFDFGPVIVWASGGRIEQLGLITGYRGKLDGAIGVGSTIAEVGAHFGNPIEEDDEDLLVVRGHEGWGFETEPWAESLGTPQENGAARITDVFVFASPRPRQDVNALWRKLGRR